MRPQGLVFATTSEIQARLGQILVGRGFETFTTSNLDRAEVCLFTCGIVATIVEWSGDPAFDAKTQELIESMYRGNQWIRLVVFNRESSRSVVERTVHSVHPDAWIHDASLGDTHLAIRLDTSLGKLIGDLCVRKGYVLHLPTGQKLTTNRTAVQLILAAPGAIGVADGSAGPTSVWRFRKWLEAVGSCVDVECEQRTRRYRLVIRDPSSQPAQDMQRPNLYLWKAA
jgi:hypothetical protein